jgi:NAD(P)H dehydrogenase (quinone)
MSQSVKKEMMSFAEKESSALAITAASGKLGHAIAKKLIAQDISQSTRLIARSPNKLRFDGRQQFDVVVGNYEDGRSMAAAFSGIDTALIISSMGPDTTRIRHHKIAIDAAIATGVKRIVYTSSANTQQHSWTRVHIETEKYLKQCGIPHTILRVGTYFSNFDYLFFAAIQFQRLFFPNVTVPISFITQDDVAAAALKVLTTRGHENKTYEILAEEPVSMSELAKMITHILGKQIIPVVIPVEAFVAQLKNKVPDYAAPLFGKFYAAIAAGECARTSKDMKILTGCPPTSAWAYLNTFIKSV